MFFEKGEREERPRETFACASDVFIRTFQCGGYLHVDTLSKRLPKRCCSSHLVRSSSYPMMNAGLCKIISTYPNHAYAYRTDLPFPPYDGGGGGGAHC